MGMCASLHPSNDGINQVKLIIKLTSDQLVCFELMPFGFDGVELWTVGRQEEYQSALLRLAPLRLAALRLEPDKFALIRVEPCKSEPSSIESFRSIPLSSDWLN